MTTQNVYHYFIRSGWQGQAETPAVVGANLLKTLDALSGIDSIFASWEIFDGRNVSSLPLSAARSRITSIVENNVGRDDFDRPSPVYGYYVAAMAGKFKDPRSVNFKVHAGGHYSEGTVLEFGEDNVVPDLTIVTYPLFRAALLAINTIWRAPWTCAQAFCFGTVAVPVDFGGVQAKRIDSVTQVPIDPAFPYSIFHIPWITYLSAPHTAGLTLPAEIEVERMPDGGLLMTSTRQRLDPTNPEHARRARVLAEAMMARTKRAP
jgi:hypothetical protein